MDNYIAKDSDGSLLVTVESIPENKAQECSPLTHCLAVVRIEDDYLFFKEARTEYGGLYGITVHGKTVEEIAAGMQDRDEVTKLALYRDVKGKETVAILDEALCAYCTQQNSLHPF